MAGEAVPGDDDGRLMPEDGADVELDSVGDELELEGAAGTFGLRCSGFEAKRRCDTVHWRVEVTQSGE